MSERLARKAMNSRHWRWMPGMAWVRKGYKHRMTNEDARLDDECYPDLDDPATYGCVIHLARLAHNSHDLFPVRTPFGFIFETNGERYSSELEALVEALVAAP